VKWFRGKTYRGQHRAIVTMLAIALTAAACSSSRGSSATGASSTGAASSSGSSSGAAGGGAGSSTTAAAGAKFGTLDSPCGKGDAKGATAQGVTDTSITIGYGDDAGFAQSPGLDAEMSDAMKGMIKWCNDQGGILGRTITGTYYDAAILQVNAVMQQACKSVFMLVGEGWALDEAAESTRVGCNLVAVPGFAVGPDFANGPMVYQGVPNPDDLTPGSAFYQMRQLFPDKVKLGFLHTTLGATESSINKAQEAATAAGFNVIDCGVKINYSGEASMAPFAQRFQTCGAQIVFYNLGSGPVLYNFLRAMTQAGVKATYLTDTNDYVQSLAQFNAGGDANNTFVRNSFQIIENASLVPAVQTFVDAVKATGGKVNQLGEQSASSFLLWATAAKACGSTLTRQCMLNQLAKVHKWDAGGLHAPTDPGANTPPTCGLLVGLTGTVYSQVFPKAQAQFDCDPRYSVKISPANWGTTLGADRIATKFLGPNILKAQP